MDLGLTGKVAIVAASSKGLGRAVATTFAREGALITVNGRDESTLAATANAIRSETGGDVIEIIGDMTNPADIERLSAIPLPSAAVWISLSAMRVDRRAAISSHFPLTSRGSTQ